MYWEYFTFNSNCLHYSSFDYLSLVLQYDLGLVEFALKQNKWMCWMSQSKEAHLTRNCPKSASTYLPVRQPVCTFPAVFKVFFFFLGCWCSEYVVSTTAVSRGGWSESINLKKKIFMRKILFVTWLLVYEKVINPYQLIKN